MWRDCTAEVGARELAAREQRFRLEQEFAQCLQRGEFEAALRLALQLEKPLRFRQLVEKILQQAPADAKAMLRRLLQKRSRDELARLLAYLREWNVVSRTVVPAQIVLSVLLTSYSFDALMQVPQIEEFVDALIAYNRRHLEVGAPRGADQANRPAAAERVPRRLCPAEHAGAAA